MPCRTLTRALTVLVWALFSTSAALLGMLPVRGWLWRPDPRPWPAALAWGVFLSTSMCITMYGGSQDLRSTTGNSAFKSAMFAYHGVLRMLEGSERCRRRGELCALVQCLRLYCASHPLSPRGWRALLGIALFCTAYGVFNGFTSMWWIQGRTSALDFERVLWATFNVGLQLYTLTLSGFTGQLARDLRQDCLRALRAAGAWVPDHNGHVAAMPSDEARLVWPARRRSTAPAARKGVGGMPSGGQVLTMIVFTVTYCSICVSTTIGSLTEVQDGPVDYLLYRIMPLQAGLGRLLFFVFACYTFQQAAQEHVKLGQALQGFLADAPDVPFAVIREIEKFIVQIALLDGYFNVLGMFRLDISAMRTILAATATYLFVLTQFRLSLY
ncbi:Gustatory receptor 79 [Frankliniella occidentalis]|nr:Gustatory receptor 79 [Frankliniella occidentalis]